jgi:hypothetical protein
MTLHQLPVPAQEIIGSGWYLSLHRVAERLEVADNATRLLVVYLGLTSDLGLENPTRARPYALDQR